MCLWMCFIITTEEHTWWEQKAKHINIWRFWDVLCFNLILDVLIDNASNVELFNDSHTYNILVWHLVTILLAAVVSILYQLLQYFQCFCSPLIVQNHFHSTLFHFVGDRVEHFWPKSKLCFLATKIAIPISFWYFLAFLFCAREILFLHMQNNICNVK